MTARQRFDAMLRDAVWPALRERGFKGSGMRVRRSDGADWQVVAFQSSRSSTRDAVEFTAEVAVGLDALRGGMLDWTAGKPPAVDQCHLRERLGFLVADREPRDWWWSADGATDYDRLGRDLVSLLVERGIPWLEARAHPELARDTLLADLRGAGVLELGALPALLELLGPRERVADVEAEWERRRSERHPIEAGPGVPAVGRPVIFTHRPGRGVLRRAQSRLGL